MNSQMRRVSRSAAVDDGWHGERRPLTTLSGHSYRVGAVVTYDQRSCFPNWSGAGQMTTYFVNPANSYVEKATGPFTWLWALLFGPFYLAYKGAWPHVLVYLMAAGVFAGPKEIWIGYLLIDIAYAVAIYPIVKGTYRRAGWVETTIERQARARHKPRISPAVWSDDRRV